VILVDYQVTVQSVSEMPVNVVEESVFANRNSFHLVNVAVEIVMVDVIITDVMVDAIRNGEILDLMRSGNNVMFVAPVVFENVSAASR
jgi:hypothetical protein